MLDLMFYLYVCSSSVMLKPAPWLYWSYEVLYVLEHQSASPDWLLSAEESFRMAVEKVAPVSGSEVV